MLSPLAAMPAAGEPMEPEESAEDKSFSSPTVAPLLRLALAVRGITAC